MSTAPPSTAASALLGFFSELASAAFLSSSVYARAAADPGAWRKAGMMVIFAAFAADSLGLYSDLDELMVRSMGSWSLVPIMIVALLRWTVACAAGSAVCRMFGEDVRYDRLLRCSGYGHAPAMLQMFPAFVYWLDLMPVTLALVVTIRWMTIPWLVAAFSIAARASGVSSLPRSIAVGVAIFLAAILFDVFIDTGLIGIVGLPDAAPLPSDAIL